MLPCIKEKEIQAYYLPPPSPATMVLVLGYGTHPNRIVRRSKSVSGQRAMKLIDYPGFIGRWPPPARNAAGEVIPLEHDTDLLISAFRILTRQRDRRFRIDILTTSQGVLYMREISDVEEIFAGVFIGFLNKHWGETIREIGEMDVTFLV